MYRLFPVCRTVLLVLVLTGASIVQASGGGSGGDESEDGNIDVYLALGAAALIGAILIFDVFSGPEGTAVGEAVAVENPVVQDTGIDWDSIIEELPPPVIAVSVFPSASGGGETALRFLRYLGEYQGEETFEIYPDPISIGLGSPAEESVLAGEFFGAGYFVTSTESDSGLVLSLYSGSQGPLWSFCTADADSLALRQAASDLAEIVAD